MIQNLQINKTHNIGRKGNGSQKSIQAIVLF